MAKTDTVKIVLRGETLRMGTPKKPETYGDGDTVDVSGTLADRLIAAKRAELAPSSAKVVAPVAEPEPDAKPAADPTPAAPAAPSESQG